MTNVDGLRARIAAARLGNPAVVPAVPVPLDIRPADRDEGESAGQYIIRQLHAMEPDFGAALAATGIAPQQLIRDVISALRTTRDLVRAAPDTVLGAAMTCAQVGLRPGVLGECWIIPFWNTDRGIREAQFVAGYQGLAQLALASGHVRGLAARTVFERDDFRLSWRHDGDELHHAPHLDGEPGAPRYYYARALLPGGGYQLTRPTAHAAMLAWRDRHVKAESGPWFDHAGGGFEWMAWKTEIRRLSKLLPKGGRFGAALAADDSVRVDLSPRADVHHVAEPVHERVGAPAPVLDGDLAEGEIK